MSDEEKDTAGDATDSDPREAWDEIERQLVEFGQRVAHLARSAMDDPETRRRAGEMKAYLEETAVRIGDVIDGAASSASVENAREKAGDATEAVTSASRRAAAEAAPHLASALRVTNEMVQGLVDRLEARAAATGSPPVPGADEEGMGDEGDDAGQDEASPVAGEGSDLSPDSSAR